MTTTRRQLGRLAVRGTMGATVTSALPRVAVAQAKVMHMRLGTPFPATHPLSGRMAEACDQIRKDTGGTVDIGTFPNNQLGGESDMVSQVRAGALDFLTTGAVLQTVVPTAALNGVPFVFNDYAQVWSAMDGPLGEYTRGAIGKAGLHAFPKILDNGFRNVTNSTRPINAVEDLKGLKIRVPVTPLWVSAFKALGAAATTINLNELYSALQTKVVDGQENPLALIDAFRVYEVQKYCSMTAHVWDGNWLVANDRKWASLPAEVQEVIARNMDETTVRQRRDVEDMNRELAGQLAAKGMVFNTPNREPFRTALAKAGFYTEWKNRYGAEAWGALESSIGAPLG